MIKSIQLSFKLAENPPMPQRKESATTATEVETPRNQKQHLLTETFLHQGTLSHSHTLLADYKIMLSGQNDYYVPKKLSVPVICLYAR